MADDELEQNFSAPITGTTVAEWTLDIITQLVAEGPANPSNRSNAAVDRLVELGEPDRVMMWMMSHAAMLVMELRDIAALNPPGSPDGMQEMYERAVLSARGIARGEPARNPFSPASEG